MYTIKFTNPAKKQHRKLPKDVELKFSALLIDLANNGPYRTNWFCHGLATSFLLQLPIAQS
jgi:mRNA-degrading endonuclease RelE of RelBE toxin-antitoxin system